MKRRCPSAIVFGCLHGAEEGAFTQDKTMRSFGGISHFSRPSIVALFIFSNYWYVFLLLTWRRGLDSDELFSRTVLGVREDIGQRHRLHKCGICIARIRARVYLY